MVLTKAMMVYLERSSDEVVEEELTEPCRKSTKSGLPRAAELQVGVD